MGEHTVLLFMYEHSWSEQKVPLFLKESELIRGIRECRDSSLILYLLYDPNCCSFFSTSSNFECIFRWQVQLLICLIQIFCFDAKYSYVHFQTGSTQLTEAWLRCSCSFFPSDHNLQLLLQRLI